MDRQPGPWEYGGRHYLVTVFSDVSTRNGLGWELEDVGPIPGRGVVLEAFRDDSNGSVTVRAFTDQPLPLALVHRFVSEVAHDLTPDS